MLDIWGAWPLWPTPWLRLRRQSLENVVCLLLKTQFITHILKSNNHQPLGFISIAFPLQQTINAFLRLLPDVF